MTALIIAAAAAAVLVLILLAPVTLRVYMTRGSCGKVTEPEIRVMGIRLRRRKKQPKPKESGDGADTGDENGGARDILRFVRENFGEIKTAVCDVLGYLFEHTIRIRELRVKSFFGTGDAMDTAMLYGAASAFVYNVLGLLDRHSRLDSHDIALRGVFEREEFYLEFETVIRARIFGLIGLAAAAAKRGMPLYKKFKGR